MDDSKEFQLMLDRAIESEPLAFKGFDRTKNVQAQLQKMVRGSSSSWQLSQSFWNWLWMKEDVISDKSMEQLWLAFVLHELHQKTWARTKTKWIKEEANAIHG